MEGIMNKELAEAQDVFLGNISLLCNKLGLNNIMAQLYAVLYLSNGPLSLNDMVEGLKISKASVSINIRALERYNAVRRAWVKGSRKDYYEAETDIEKVIMNRLKSMTNRRLSEIDVMLKSSYSIFNSEKFSDKENDYDIKIFKERLGKLRNFHNRIQMLFNLFNSGMLDTILHGKLSQNNKEYSVSKN